MTHQDNFSLKGKTAIITGSGKGIGKAIALAFAEAGANVVCVARTQADIDAVAEQASQYGVKSLAVVCDVMDESALNALVVQTLEVMGQVDILVNNAGGARPGPAMSVSGEQLTRDFEFNVTTAFNLCRIVAPHLQAQSGSIVNITSAAARYSQKNFSSYGTSKAALDHLTHLLAAEFAPTIRVNAISPGAIMTEALEQFLDEASTQAVIERTPMKAMGKPEDIANAAVFLASPAARWITGKTLEVDGGAESTPWPF
ncbi:SDR family NAD(P)-dependent oxidoreductase [Endozoicomonas numazuensis]|uniref:Short-chain dehydrogenase n=1 Tax=Endozoicomonas numazuensis TaxID=1137799 RepID=A0A081NEG9_9GAMM|nr:glucose 1-dehydrogenase [Endozoicomonas numazuensis]KEQ16842.1 short-chain dehydrogenase [Endozoicomonas numazuensis]